MKIFARISIEVGKITNLDLEIQIMNSGKLDCSIVNQFLFNAIKSLTFMLTLESLPVDTGNGMRLSYGKNDA